MNLDNIIHHITSKKSIKKYPGIKDYKECWSLINQEFNYKRGDIVAAILKDNNFVAYTEYKNIRQEFRKQKIQKINEKI